jgi:hypothetical protein
MKNGRSLAAPASCFFLGEELKVERAAQKAAVSDTTTAESTMS